MNARRYSRSEVGLIVLAALFVGGWSTSVHALPDPFDAYESSKQEEPPRENKPPNREEKEPETSGNPPTSEEDTLSSHTEKGAWVLGAGTLFNYTTTTNELTSGRERDNTTLFFRIDPSLGYFVIDNLEVAVSAGLLGRQLERGGNDPATETSWLFEVSARYFWTLNRRFSLFFGLGLGGYFGSSERLITVEQEGEGAQTITERTDTLGGSVSSSLGVGYALSRSLQFRAGLGFSGLLGQETLTSAKDPLAVSTLNTGLAIGVYYTF